MVIAASYELSWIIFTHLKEEKDENPTDLNSLQGFLPLDYLTLCYQRVF
jgi:hypothetical protein